MSKPALGRLEKVDLRSYWEHEATEFTPWLAREESIALLGEAIGMELEVQEEEVNVGPFRADILCRDTTDDSLVLIENQLERTNHGHLGQILTYAAGLDAVSVIWVARRFTEEHRAALDWLNRITEDDFNFLGLEVELWRIGGSQVAPKFNLVAKPNQWSRTVRGAASGSRPMSDTRQLYLEYWTKFIGYAEQVGSRLKIKKPRAKHALGFSLGRTHFAISAWAKTQFGRGIGVRLNLSGQDAKAHFRLLMADREDIEKELGLSPRWDEKPDRAKSTISVQHECDPSDQELWAELHRWTLEKVEVFDRVFRPRVRVLDASEWAEGEEVGAE